MMSEKHDQNWVLTLSVDVCRIVLSTVLQLCRGFSLIIFALLKT